MRLAITNLSIVQQDLDFRIDADFYSHPFRQKFLELKRELHFSTLKKETDFIGSGHTPYKHNMRDGDIPFITVECVGDLEFSYNKTKRITNEQYESEYKNKIIKKGAVICTIKRRICKAYPFLSETKKMALNQDVALIYPKEELLSGFLAVYFNCSFGQGFADSLKTEQMNPYISLVNLAKLPVPLLDIIFQQRIEDIVLLSQQIKSQSERKYKDAQYLLLSELGLSNWKPKHQLSFIKNYSETEQAERIDAEYYKPKYDVLLQIIDQNSEYTKKISEIKVYNARGLQPKYSSNGSLDVITSKRILENGLDFDNFDKTDLENWDLQKKARIKKGSILTYTTGANIGRTAIYQSEKKALASNHVNILIVDKEDPEYVAFVINSLVGRLQTERLSAGSAQAELYPKDIENFVIPFISEEKQNQIKKKVTDSFTLRKQSKHLLDCAKKAVEMAIEKDEKTAINWLESQIS